MVQFIRYKTTCSLDDRRGVATVWILLAVPAALLMLVMLVDIANLWLARIQLTNALEAATQAAAKEWGESGGGDTMTPREIAVEYAKANTVIGTALNISTNYDPTMPVPFGNPNQNLSCAGNLIFGAVSLQPPFSFDASVAPQCEKTVNFGTVGLNIEIKTKPNGTTFDEPKAFFIEFLNPPSTPAGVFITSVTYDLQGAGGDNGEFDVDTTPPASEILMDAFRQGWGPFANLSASTGIAGPVTFTPNGASAGQSSTLQIDFGAGDFAPGDKFVFGVDTDKVASGLGDMDDTDDDGGDFRDAGADFQLSLTFNNGATVVITGADSEVKGGGGKTFTPQGLTKDLLVIIPATGEFGVRAQATVPVQSLWCHLFGYSFGPYNVTAKATARSGCTSTCPQLIHVDTFLCPTP